MGLTTCFAIARMLLVCLCSRVNLLEIPGGGECGVIAIIVLIKAVPLCLYWNIASLDFY